MESLQIYEGVRGLIYGFAEVGRDADTGNGKVLVRVVEFAVALRKL